MKKNWKNDRCRYNRERDKVLNDLAVNNNQIEKWKKWKASKEKKIKYRYSVNETKGF